MKTKDDAITLADAASIIGRSQSTVRRLIEQGRLPAVRLRAGNQPLVVRRNDAIRLRAWLDAEGELARQATVPTLRSDDPRLQKPEAQRVRRRAKKLLEQIARQREQEAQSA